VEPRRSRSPRKPRATARNQGDARNDITESRINRACIERGSRRRDDEGEYDDDYEDEDEDEEELSGAVCFSRRVRKTYVLKGFKLPMDKIKYEGVQEPEVWLDEYLQTIRVQGGTKATAMRSLQLFLSRPIRSWLRKMPEGSIEHWDDLHDRFTRNFWSTFKRPTVIEELWKCIQKSRESMRSYLQRWSMIKN
jgi:hypothetical protein